ncbi:hypothetical protein BGZ80_004848 [Entomortierella chlamydospora]|uniref:Uncharacterized protein n=1 Tax=Entomortierella chlamydospora TaxID=101097 RepID=A0A9P6MMC0_9FUNG|nr:hypothetical protein BGZ80_004848 [Entomortierella chlamydospora]
MPGSTTRPWYPTFGPAITTSCSDSTIQLDNPNQFTLINNAKLNRHAVGPHWRSIQTSATYSPTPSPPASSPLLHSNTVAPSSLSSRLSTASTTTALHAYLSSTYSSAASIDYARATSFHQYDQTMTENKGTQQQPSHQEYYQSHSYPHDSRHHSMQSNQPSNSREARENMLVTNRLFLTPNTSATSHTGKRRATWQDEGDESDEDKNDSASPQAMQVFSSSENVSHPRTEQSSVQQFVPATVFTEQSTIVESGAPVSQDQEMRSAEKRLSTQSTTSSCVNRDVESMDQDDMEVVAETISTAEDRLVDTPQPRQVKRSKQRLDWTVYGIESVAEARRLQSGEQVKDIFQECFYNAAAPTSR